MYNFNSYDSLYFTAQPTLKVHYWKFCYSSQWLWKLVMLALVWQDLKDYMRQAGEVVYADAHRIRPNEGFV